MKRTNTLKVIISIFITLSLMLVSRCGKQPETDRDNHPGDQSFVLYNKNYDHPDLNHWGIRGEVTGRSGVVGQADSSITVSYKNEFHFTVRKATITLETSQLDFTHCFVDSGDTPSKEIQIGDRLEVYGNVSDKSSAKQIVVENTVTCSNQAAGIATQEANASSVMPGY